jgi:hypothetical protein
MPIDLNNMKLILTLVTTLFLAPLAELHAVEGDSVAFDIALQPAHVIVAPWRQHVPQTKRQGVAGIERTAKGKLWTVYGRDVESTRNFQVLKYSNDDGKTWSEVKLMILPRTGTSAHRLARC